MNNKTSSKGWARLGYPGWRIEVGKTVALGHAKRPRIPATGTVLGNDHAATRLLRDVVEATTQRLLHTSWHFCSVPLRCVFSLLV